MITTSAMPSSVAGPARRDHQPPQTPRVDCTASWTADAMIKPGHPDDVDDLLPANAVQLLEDRPGLYVHLIAGIGSHHHRRRFNDAAHRVRQQFRPASTVAVELGPCGVRYANSRRSARTGCPSDTPDIAVFLTDPAGDLNQRTYERLLALIAVGVPMWRVIPRSEDGPTGVHPPGSYQLRLRRRPAGWRYAHAEQSS